MSAKNEWTPYGLEAIRIAHLRRRRILGFLAVLGLGLLAYWATDSSTSSEFDISVNGKSGGNGIQLDVPPEDESRNKPVSVSLSPGRVTRAEAGGPEPSSSVQRGSAPSFTRAAPYNFSALLLFAAPWALIGAAFWLVGKRRGKHDEVNYGVYKGAMPLEMITAGASKSVFTRKHARASVFGRRRVDHVPPEVLAAEAAEGRR